MEKSAVATSESEIKLALEGKVDAATLEKVLENHRKGIPTTITFKRKPSIPDWMIGTSLSVLATATLIGGIVSYRKNKAKAK